MKVHLSQESWTSEGFKRWPRTENFSASVADSYYIEHDSGITFRALAKPEHCNGIGVVHGGFLSTLADSWMASNVASRLPRSARFVTSSLAVDFLSPASPGDILESQVDRIKTGKKLCFAYGAIVSKAHTIVTVRAIFSVVDI